jgi:hypothetical protein
MPESSSHISTRRFDCGGALALSLIGALLWLGFPWSVLGLILATIAVILSVAQQKAA